MTDFRMIPFPFWMTAWCSFDLGNECFVECLGVKVICGEPKLRRFALIVSLVGSGLLVIVQSQSFFWSLPVYDLYS